MSATAATDLNLRAGPGPGYAVLSVIPANGAVTVDGCLAEANWCQVTFEGAQGWAYGKYLTGAVADSEPVVVIENREPLQVATVEYVDDPADDVVDATVGGGVGAAIAGALIGGPAAIAAGAVLGAAAGAADTDPVVTYVTENPVDPSYLEGEVVVGAGIPEGVEIIQVPDTSYGYLNVNGLPVVVDTSNRQIVRIVR